MKKIIRNNLKIFVSIIVTTIIVGSLSVYAASQYFAKDISYTPNNVNFKKENGESIDNVEDALNELYDKQINNNSMSKTINNINFNIIPENNNLKVNVELDSIDQNKILGYHVFAIDDNNQIYSNISTSKEIILTGLTSNTNYSVYVKAYDIFDKSIKSKSITQKTTYSLSKKTYTNTINQYPYILTTNNNLKLLTYGDCNINLKKMYVKIQIGNSGAISSSNISAYVYGKTNNNWELIKEYKGTRGVKSTLILANETIDLSNNEKNYTDFYVSAKSSDNEIYANIEIQPTGILVD